MYATCLPTSSQATYSGHSRSGGLAIAPSCTTPSPVPHCTQEHPPKEAYTLLDDRTVVLYD